MAQPTLVIQDANGVKQTVFTHSPNGQNTADNSQSVVLASDDLLVQKVATESTLSNIANKIPAKGSALKASSLPVTLATDDVLLSTVATEASLSGLSNKVATDATLTALSNKVATETTVAAISTKVATDANLVAISNKVATETTAAAISTTATAISNKVATETTLGAISAKTPALGQSVKTGSVPVTLASDQGNLTVLSVGGLGSLTLVPNGSANGTAIGIMPAGATGLRIYLGTGDTVTFTISSSAPSSPPPRVFTIGGSTTGPNWDENLSGGQMMYITAVSGSPQFRWV